MNKQYVIVGKAKVTLEGTATIYSLGGEQLAQLDLTDLPPFETDIEHSIMVDPEKGMKITLNLHVPVEITADRIN